VEYLLGVASHSVVLARMMCENADVPKKMEVLDHRWVPCRVEEEPENLRGKVAEDEAVQESVLRKDTNMAVEDVAWTRSIPQNHRCTRKEVVGTDLADDIPVGEAHHRTCHGKNRGKEGRRNTDHRSYPVAVLGNLPFQ